MTSSRHRASSFRYFQYGVAAIVACLVLPPSLLAFSACASSETMDGDADTGAILVAGDAGDAGDAAQDSDAAAAPCGVGNVCRVPTKLSGRAVLSMNGRSKSDVWASGSNGVLIHWDGQQWTELESGDAGQTALWSLSSIVLTPSEVWGVVGSHYALRRGLDPTSLRIAVPMSAEGYYVDMLNVVAVFGNDDAYVSIVQDNTGLEIERPLYKLDFDSGVLTSLPKPLVPETSEGMKMRIQASFLVPDKALWLVGNRAAVVRYPISSTSDGDATASAFGQGVVLPLASQADLLSAWGQGEELWAAGRNGVILHFDGTNWRTEESGTKATLNAIFGLSPNDIWAVGEAGTVLHFDGNRWLLVGIDAYSGNLKAIWGSASDDVWIGGEDGMFHWGGVQ